MTHLAIHMYVRIYIMNISQYSLLFLFVCYSFCIFYISYLAYILCLDQTHNCSFNMNLIRRCCLFDSIKMIKNKIKILSLQNKRGSFLSRSKNDLAKMASMLKPVANPQGPRSTRNFVFQSAESSFGEETIAEPPKVGLVWVLRRNHG